MDFNEIPVIAYDWSQVNRNKSPIQSPQQWGPQAKQPIAYSPQTNLNNNASNNPYSKESYSPNLNPSTINNINHSSILNSPFSKKQDQLMSAQENAFKVCVRVRPLNSQEASSPSNNKRQQEVVKVQDNMIVVLDPDNINPNLFQAEHNKREQSYIFDEVFCESVKTQQLYKQMISPMVTNALNGFNSTIFAYGQTGAGKSYTMFGEDYISAKQEIYLDSMKPSNQKGVVFLLLDEIFDRIQNEKENVDRQFTIKISYLQIYNEKIHDLLVPQDKQAPLVIIEDPQRGIYVPDLTQYIIQDVMSIKELITKGNSARVMASTSSNEFSSRSHSIIQINIQFRDRARDIVDHVTVSRLSLIDLAGSQRAAVSQNRGLRMMEGANINRSLLALGNCINILSDTKKAGAFVPYRDSQLTRLLKDSLGGNTKTLMISCIGPSSLTYEETINTLQYANRARYIQQKIFKNTKQVEMHVSQYKEIIESLKKEVQLLRDQLKTKDETVVNKGTQTGLDQSSLQQTSNSSATLGYGKQDKIVNSNTINTQSANSQKEQKSIDDILNAILANIEQNVEINQTLSELNNLKQINENELQNKHLFLIGNSDTRTEDKDRTIHEMNELKQNMQNNEQIFNQMQQNLEKNICEKNVLQEKMKEMMLKNTQINSDNSILNNFTMTANISSVSSTLSNGFNGNSVKNKTSTKNKSREKSIDQIKIDSKVQLMEKELADMQKQLDEKDKVIAQNHQIIERLQKTGSDTSATSVTPYQDSDNSAQTQNNNHKYSQNMTNKQKTQLENYTPSIQINQNASQTPVTNISNYNSHHTPNNLIQVNRISAATSLSSNINGRSLQAQQNSEKHREEQRQDGSPILNIYNNRVRELNQDLQGTVENIKSINKNDLSPSPINRIGKVPVDLDKGKKIEFLDENTQREQKTKNQQKQTFKTMKVSLDELKDYAYQIKDLDFQKVQMKQKVKKSYRYEENVAGNINNITNPMTAQCQVNSFQKLIHLSPNQHNLIPTSDNQLQNRDLSTDQKQNSTFQHLNGQIFGNKGDINNYRDRHCNYQDKQNRQQSDQDFYEVSEIIKEADLPTDEENTMIDIIFKDGKENQKNSRQNSFNLHTQKHKLSTSSSQIFDNINNNSEGHATSNQQKPILNIYSKQNYEIKSTIANIYSTQKCETNNNNINNNNINNTHTNNHRINSNQISQNEQNINLSQEIINLNMQIEEALMSNETPVSPKRTLNNICVEQKENRSPIRDLKLHNNSLAAVEPDFDPNQIDIQIGKPAITIIDCQTQPSMTRLSVDNLGFSSTMTQIPSNSVAVNISNNNNDVFSHQKFNLKTLDEAREKLRNFKIQLMYVAEKVNKTVREGPFNEYLLTEVKGLLSIYSRQSFTISSADEAILQELKRIVKEFEENQSPAKKTELYPGSSASSDEDECHRGREMDIGSDHQYKQFGGNQNNRDQFAKFPVVNSNPCSNFDNDKQILEQEKDILSYKKKILNQENNSKNCTTASTTTTLNQEQINNYYTNPVQNSTSSNNQPFQNNNNLAPESQGQTPKTQFQKEPPSQTPNGKIQQGSFSKIITNYAETVKALGQQNGNQNNSHPQGPTQFTGYGPTNTVYNQQNNTQMGTDQSNINQNESNSLTNTNSNFSINANSFNHNGPTSKSGNQSSSSGYKRNKSPLNGSDNLINNEDMSKANYTWISKVKKNSKEDIQRIQRQDVLRQYTNQIISLSNQGNNVPSQGENRQTFKEI